MLSETEQTAYLLLIAKCLTAIVPIAISCAVAYIAYQQHKLAKERFKLDLFEKRYAVYEKIRNFILNVVYKNRDGYIEMLDTESKFQESIHSARFLFDEKIFNFANDIGKKGMELSMCRENKISEDDQSIKEKKTELIADLENLQQVFAPYLKFKNWK